MNIPSEFENEIKAHLAGNYLNLDGYPVILAIVGPPGMGKTSQSKEVLKRLGIQTFYLSAADFENEWAGIPAQMFRERYIQASECIENGRAAAIVIDDVDTTLGEWKDNTGTVNHQALLAFLMHIADNPCQIEYAEEGVTVKTLNVYRVPIIMTGNYIEKMYEPLVRAGRTSIYRWNPGIDQKKIVLKGIFPENAEQFIDKIVEQYPEKSIADFVDIYHSANKQHLAELAKAIYISRIVNSNELREAEKKRFLERLSNMDWKEYFEENEDIIWGKQ